MDDINDKAPPRESCAVIKGWNESIAAESKFTQLAKEMGLYTTYYVKTDKRSEFVRYPLLDTEKLNLEILEEYSLVLQRHLGLVQKKLQEIDDIFGPHSRAIEVFTESEINHPTAPEGTQK